jgi:DNA-binding XRE family transcriptional regulator
MDNETNNYLEYFEILELEPDERITLLDIENAYQKLKTLYSSGSIVMDPLDDEIDGEEHEEILNQLEEAYKILIRYIVDKDRQQKELKEEKAPKIIEDTLVEYIPQDEEEDDSDDIQLPDVVSESADDNAADSYVVDHQDELTRLELDVDMENLAQSPQAVYDALEYTPSERSVPTVSIELPEEPDLNLTDDSTVPLGEVETTGTQTREFEKQPVESSPREPVEPTEPAEPAEPETIDNGEEEKELEITIDEDVLKADVDSESRHEAEISLVSGRKLRKIREKKGMGIHEVALATKISYKILVNIEKERFDELPDAGYLRWYVSTYAKALSMNSKKAADEYMKHYRQWERERGKHL